jgi:hypothetical protein
MIILITTTKESKNIDRDLYYYAPGDSFSGIALKNPPENAPVITNNSTSYQQ